MAKITQVVEELALPFAREQGCSIWDVEYVKEAGTWFLRVYLDHPEGVNIDHCEAVSRLLSDKLDEVDPIEGSYVLEVSSPGADRVLKKPEHFEQFMGEDVEVRLYRPRNGRKALTGKLLGRTAEALTLEINSTEEVIEDKDIAQVRLAITF